MIAIVKAGNVWAPPMEWERMAVIERLYELGFTVQGGILHSPDGDPINFPDQEPTAPLVLGGVSVLPVVTTSDQAPNGATLSGYSLLVNPESIVRKPVWSVPAPPPSLDAARAAKSASITVRANSIMAAMSAEYGEYERQTWDRQAQEARELQADPQASAPLVRNIAAARGMEVAEMVTRILANEATWKTISGSIVGRRLALQDALDACTTLEAVASLDIGAGWPV